MFNFTCTQRHINLCAHACAGHTHNIKELQYLHLHTHEIIHILQGQLDSSIEILSMCTLWH